MKVKRNCILCSKPYEVCTDRLKLGSIYTSFDSPEHFSIFDILNDYSNNKIDIETAKSKLSKYYNSEENYGKYTKQIREIMEFKQTDCEPLSIKQVKQECREQSQEFQEEVQEDSKKRRLRSK